MSSALIVTGGSVSIKQLVTIYKQGRFDLVFGVDGGMNYLQLADISPSLILGDFDSCDQDILKAFQREGVEVLTFPAKKNLTDTHIAIEVAIERGADSLVILGCIGTRMDHTMGALMSIAKYKSQVGIEIIDAHNSIVYPDGCLEIEKGDYKYISLIPLSETIEGVSFKGVKYPLEDARLHRMDTLGISNEVEDEKAVLTYKEGVVAVIRSKD